MFISIPREFFVPVVFGDNFTLNEENNNLELDLNMYRESNTKKEDDILKNNKKYLEDIYMFDEEFYEDFCSYDSKVFEELDDEFIDDISNNLKGCRKIF